VEPLDIKNDMKHCITDDATKSNINKLSDLNPTSFFSHKTQDFVKETLTDASNDYGVLNALAKSIAVLEYNSKMADVRKIVKTYMHEIGSITSNYFTKNVRSVFMKEDKDVEVDDVNMLIAYIAIFDIKF